MFREPRAARAEQESTDGVHTSAGSATRAGDICAPFLLCARRAENYLIVASPAKMCIRDRCIIDLGVDLEEVIPKIVDGRAFNNGLPCACEQAVMIHRDDVDAALRLSLIHI